MLTEAIIILHHPPIFVVQEVPLESQALDHGHGLVVEEEHILPLVLLTNLLIVSVVGMLAVTVPKLIIFQQMLLTVVRHVLILMVQLNLVEHRLRGLDGVRVLEEANQELVLKRREEVLQLVLVLDTVLVQILHLVEHRLSVLQLITIVLQGLVLVIQTTQQPGLGLVIVSTEE